MIDIETNTSTSINVINNCLILSLPPDLNSEQQDQIKQKMLLEINNKKIFGVVLDFSAITIIDGYEFIGVINFSKMIELLGSITVFTGLRPSVVASIIELNVDTSKLNTYNNLEDGISFILSQNNK